MISTISLPGYIVLPPGVAKNVQIREIQRFDKSDRYFRWASMLQITGLKAFQIWSWGVKRPLTDLGYDVNKSKVYSTGLRARLDALPWKRVMDRLQVSYYLKKITFGEPDSCPLPCRTEKVNAEKLPSAKRNPIGSETKRKKSASSHSIHFWKKTNIIGSNTGILLMISS